MADKYEKFNDVEPKTCLYTKRKQGGPTVWWQAEFLGYLDENNAVIRTWSPFSGYKITEYPIADIMILTQ